MESNWRINVSKLGLSNWGINFAENGERIPLAAELISPLVFPSYTLTHCIQFVQNTVSYYYLTDGLLPTSTGTFILGWIGGHAFPDVLGPYVADNT